MLGFGLSTEGYLAAGLGRILAVPSAIVVLASNTSASRTRAREASERWMRLGRVWAEALSQAAQGVATRISKS
ncbi:MAG: hypothetical protein AAGD10_06810 [Myxococcota bacterium]